MASGRPAEVVDGSQPGRSQAAKPVEARKAGQEGLAAWLHWRCDNRPAQAAHFVSEDVKPPARSRVSKIFEATWAFVKRL